jgi:quercetin dioxygenase-like cupin family protein
VINGKGILILKDREHELRKGDFALILPNEMHQFKNSSESQNFRIICAVPKEYE